MLNKILRLLSKKQPNLPSPLDAEAAKKWYNEKSLLMEKILGKEHDMVMHAIIPYAVGGGLDLYYYPNGIEGVGIATKELSDNPNQGSTNDVFDLYEFAMFTRFPLDLDQAKDRKTEFGKAHSNINAVLNIFAPYSAQATLNPNETCEFPEDMEEMGGKCFILDAFNSEVSTDQFGIMVVIEIYRSEMDYARENGGEQLIKKLKDQGYHPYSDLNRKPVV
jgi:hypothetical protein